MRNDMGKKNTYRQTYRTNKPAEPIFTSLNGIKLLDTESRLFKGKQLKKFYSRPSITANGSHSRGRVSIDCVPGDKKTNFEAWHGF
jgi:hypothetical protein